MNHLLELSVLRNRYYALRHGDSAANRQGIIVSHPDNGLFEYGLSQRGAAQVETSLAGVAELGPDTLILSSDFRRARESAEIARQKLKSARPLETDARLRERFFGEYELGSDHGYAEVWREDEIDADSRRRGVESANQVMARVTRVVSELEQSLGGVTLLLVSHGDALQILQTAFQKQDAARHRRIDHLETAEIRLLDLASSQGHLDICQ